jgi:hypothetical protein
MGRERRSERGKGKPDRWGESDLKRGRMMIRRKK